MKQEIFEIEKNENIAENTWRMELSGEIGEIRAPGQFVNIRLEGRFLRRPISVCGCSPGKLTLIYKTVGEGTYQMSKMRPGERLDLLVGLGNGFDMEKSGDSPLLIGGGAGVSPLYWLCEKLRGQGKSVSVILGFNKREEVYYNEQFAALGARVYVTTADGGTGTRGFVTDVMKTLDYSYFYACGPAPMYNAVNDVAKTDGQLSFEERMGCGFGACMGCGCQTLTGSKRVCRDGPVFERGEILWPTQP